MDTLDARLAALKTVNTSESLKERLYSQLEYAIRLSAANNNKYDYVINNVISFVDRKSSEEGVLTREAVYAAESLMSEISQEAKKLSIVCAAHSHIDMNWMWRWDETVAITLDTFRTMLNLMKEYPDFKFSQSQASVYKIVEKYDPEMLEEIKARVSENRWEVTASTWVEADKNLTSGESMARHILYAKSYLSKLLDLKPEVLDIDFEPDTFGHSMHVPEVLAGGGVKYYYHCRGYTGHILYKWEAPSGNSVITYRDPFWYNNLIEPSMAFYAPEFCSNHGMNCILKVYGVGDHGGGPTRRDLEKIIDMNSWPVFPSIKFGTFGEFFSEVNKIEESLPVVKGELNSVFTGCYTTQARIKTANRVAEAALNEAELFESVSALYTGSKYPFGRFAGAWENVLFNQFHDIIPGSGTVDTREYAMGLFQNTMAEANTSRSFSMRKIAAAIDTTGLGVKCEASSDSRSEGAGVGFGMDNFKIMEFERGTGKTRIFHVFNTSASDRDEPLEITVWDWDGDTNRILFKDGNGKEIDHQLVESGVNRYWGHNYIKVLIKARVPGYGYSTYTMTENHKFNKKVVLNTHSRVEQPYEFVLQNKFIKVTFDTKSVAIISIIDRSSGEELVDKSRPGGIFRLIQEDDSLGMTAWLVGRHMDVRDLVNNVQIKKVNLWSRFDYEKECIRQAISYEIAFQNSTIKVEVYLDYDSPKLNYKVECDWCEVGRKGKPIPQLAFYMPVGYKCSSYKYDIPFGTINRKPSDIDMPANSFVMGIREEEDKKSVMLVTDSKYGFRGIEDSMSITLIRSSYDPDPYPEVGVHKFKFAVCVVEPESNINLIDKAYCFNHPMNVISGTVHEGSLSPTGSFIQVEQGDITVSSIKMAEGSSGTKKLIIRVYESEGKSTMVGFKFFSNPVCAYFVDINEKRRVTIGELEVEVESDKVSFEMAPFSVCSICVEF